jgi:hypothetical protein
VLPESERAGGQLGDCRPRTEPRARNELSGLIRVPETIGMSAWHSVFQFGDAPFKRIDSRQVVIPSPSVIECVLVRSFFLSSLRMPCRGDSKIDRKSEAAMALKW